MIPLSLGDLRIICNRLRDADKAALLPLAEKALLDRCACAIQAVERLDFISTAPSLDARRFPPPGFEDV